jgi:BlaR1 peptidase M56
MILASTLVALPLLAMALIARRLRSDLEEAAWRLTAVTMLLTPLASLLPKIDIGMNVVPAEPSTVAAPSIIAAVYALVALVLLARLAIGAVLAWRLRSNAKPFGDAYLSNAVLVPVTVGLFAPAILLPADAPTWSEAKLAAVLAHEQAHVTDRDPLWRFVGRLAAAVSWFHPFAWLAAASMGRIAEERADEQAVSATGDRHEYATVILDFLRVMTRSPRRVLAVGMLDGRALSTRIDAILQPARTRRSRLVTRVVLATFVFCAIFMTGMTTNDARRPDYPVYQQQRSDLEFFRKRDEIRDAARTQLRETMQRLFRGLIGH